MHTQRVRTVRLRRALPSALAAAGLALVTALGACADQPPTGPNPAGPAARASSYKTTTSTSTTVSTLRRDVPLAANITRTWTIRRSAGGSIDWPEVGLKVIVPANAFQASAMTISITALRGAVIAYDFAPAGTQFALPLALSQRLRGTSWYKADYGKTLQGAYFRSAAQVRDSTNTAQADELLPADTDLLNSQVKFKITHFSGYMVSTNASKRLRVAHVPVYPPAR
jgi:hypothetical protein